MWAVSQAKLVGMTPQLCIWLWATSLDKAAGADANQAAGFGGDVITSSAAVAALAASSQWRRSLRSFEAKILAMAREQWCCEASG